MWHRVNADPLRALGDCAPRHHKIQEVVIIIMVRVGEDQGILTLEHQKDTLGVLP